jgi:uncharacterized protein (DUF952 family)
MGAQGGLLYGMQIRRILHIARADEWDAAQQSGFYEGPTLAGEGFIHCAEPGQLMHVVTRYFPVLAGHVILEIDPERVAAPVKWEGARPDVADSLPDGFPHIYGPLNVDAVVRQKRI